MTATTCLLTTAAASRRPPEAPSTPLPGAAIKCNRLGLAVLCTSLGPGAVPWSARDGGLSQSLGLITRRKDAFYTGIGICVRIVPSNFAGCRRFFAAGLPPLPQRRRLVTRSCAQPGGL